MNISDEVLELLKEEIPKVEFNHYIKQLIFDEKDSKSDYIVYRVPNQFIANWVKNKYSSKIAHLFEVKTGIAVSIDILITKNSKKNSKKATIDNNIYVDNNSESYNISILNPSFTFENFIVGSSNQFAYTASKSIAENPGKRYNPLFIYGSVGLGKTHLAQAIGNLILEKRKLSVIYTTVEQFLNEFTRHLRNKTMDRFKEKYRKCGILIIDDIQFLSGKTETQEEIFHTFNELYNKKKQIVLTADKPLKYILGLEDRLKSRFESGLVANIDVPELETKIAIIKKKCELNGIHLDNNTINYIASIIESNIREIEGVITKLHAHSTLMGQKITETFTKNILKEQIMEKRENITIDYIIKIISKELNIKPSEIKSKSRKKEIVNARRIAIYIARNVTLNSMPVLAKAFNMKDHTSVSHTMKTINNNIKEDKEFEFKIKELTNKIINKID